MKDRGWERAVALYDSLSGPSWQHISAFRELVIALAGSPQAALLTAVTSHEVLTVSPYARHPDWFRGRRVVLHPLPDGHVRIEHYDERLAPRPSGSWTLALEEARERALQLLEKL